MKYTANTKGRWPRVRLEPKLFDPLGPASRDYWTSELKGFHPKRDKDWLKWLDTMFSRLKVAAFEKYRHEESLNIGMLLILPDYDIIMR